MPAAMALFFGFMAEANAQQGNSSNSLPGTSTGGGQGTETTTPQQGTRDNSRQPAGQTGLEQNSNASSQSTTSQSTSEQVNSRRNRRSVDGTTDSGAKTRNRSKTMRKSSKMKSTTSSN